MGRPKGSKNKTTTEEQPTPEVNLPEDTELLGETTPKPKKLLGYHPVTGAEVWE